MVLYKPIGCHTEQQYITQRTATVLLDFHISIIASTSGILLFAITVAAVIVPWHPSLYALNAIIISNLHTRIYIHHCLALSYPFWSLVTARRRRNRHNT